MVCGEMAAAGARAVAAGDGGAGRSDCGGICGGLFFDVEAWRDTTIYGERREGPYALGDDLAALNLKGDVVNGGVASVPLRKVVYGNHKSLSWRREHFPRDVGESYEKKDGGVKPPLHSEKKGRKFSGPFLLPADQQEEFRTCRRLRGVVRR